MALDTNLLAYYKMSNGAYTNDSVASYTLTSSTSTQQSGGFFDYCGSGDNIYYAGNYGLTGTSDVSISWWVKFTTDIASGGSGLTFFNSTLTTDRFIALDYNYNGGSRKIDLYASNNSITGSYTVTLGTTWHHIAITRSSGTVKLYLDGVERISGSQSTATGSQDRFYLGTGKAFGGTSTQYYDEAGVWSRALTADDVAKIYNAGRGNQYPFTDDLTTSIVSYWKLDESSGNAVDSVGSTTLTNSNVTYATGKINNGAVFNSTSDTLIGTSISNPLSFSFWYNVTQGNSVTYLANASPDNTIQSKSSRFTWQIYDGTSSRDFTTTVKTATWTHVVFVYNGTGYLLYENGTYIETVTSNQISFDKIGRSGSNINGTIDEVGIWNRALTSGEVTELYNSGVGLQYPFIVAITFAISETLTLTESISNLRTRLFSTSETVTLTETISVLKGIAFTVAEALGLVETFTSLRGRLFTVAESLGLVEVMARIKLLWTNSTKENTTWTEQTKETTNWTNSDKSI